MNKFPHGLFLTLEGLESSGKSTLAKRLDEALSGMGYETLVVGEPGGTAYGQQARELFLNNHSKMVPEAEVGLLLTAKAQLLQEKILPALADGKIVICDRYTDTLFAYQHHAKGHDRKMMEEMLRAFNCQRMPDFTLLLRIDPEVSLRRSLERKAAGGAYTDLDAAPTAFHYAVSIGLIKELHYRAPGAYAVINAELDLDTVFETALERVTNQMDALRVWRETAEQQRIASFAETE